MGDRVSTILAVSFFVLFSVAIMSAEPGSSAMLYSSGAVTVNGVSSAATSAVFAGDTIRTDDKSAARISTVGATLLIPPSSSVTYRKESVDLNSGQMEIRASSAIRARVAGLTISPAKNGAASFQIARLNGSIAISAELGSLVVNDGLSNTLVQEGTTTRIDEPQPPEPQSKKKKRGGAMFPGEHTSLATKAVVVVGGVVTAIIVRRPDNPTGNEISKDQR